MFSYIHKKREQKELFFQLDTEFKKNNDEKTAGIYVIYKDEICLYVGQSKNIASRLATHLSGKYKGCSKILVFTIEDSSDNLIPLEKFVIQKLKPIENVLADFTENVKRDELAEGSILYETDRAECYNEEFDIHNAVDFTILNNKHDLFISDSEAGADLYYFDDAFTFLNNLISSIAKSKNGENNEH
jgi:hypothetical protein